MATTKKQPAKKAAAKKSTPVVKKAAVKKVVEKTPTLEQQLKQKSEAFVNLANCYNKLSEDHFNLKNSFKMIKDNYEREKNRLDKLIETGLNSSKSLVEVLKYENISEDQIEETK